MNSKRDGRIAKWVEFLFIYWLILKRSTENCGGGNGGGSEGAAGRQHPHFSEPPESSTVGDEDFNTDGFASPEFPTPSPTFSSVKLPKRIPFQNIFQSGGGFSMSTGTTSGPSSSGYPATRIPPEEGEEWKEERPKGGKQPKKPPSKGSKGGRGGKEEEEGSEEMEGREAHGGEGVYVERPTLSIIQKTKRWGRLGDMVDPFY